MGRPSWDSVEWQFVAGLRREWAMMPLPTRPVRLVFCPTTSAKRHETNQKNGRFGKKAKRETFLFIQSGVQDILYLGVV